MSKDRTVPRLGLYDSAIAHVAEDFRVHSLIDHLRGTSQRAERFAGAFNAAGWGRLAGLWHDLGKFSPDFQRYIRAASGLDAHLETKIGRVDHSTPGAVWAIDKFDLAGRVLAYPIAGHHAGLPDWVADATGGAALSARLRNPEHLKKLTCAGIPAEILGQPLPPEKPNGYDPAFWIRMLFSCVVDADFLDTEAFFDPERRDTRGGYPTLDGLLPFFENHMATLLTGADQTKKVNRIRASVLHECREAARRPPGAYTLTVPTGGGKTLSSMSFALHHAVLHGKERVIYVVPYTSIIEQNAEVFREIFGDAVLEHHSNLDASDPSRDSPRSRLACENWDAPIVVTTSVQFFESLFAARTSRSRKIHNIANSVVILDEAQLLPPEFLNPILGVLDELRKNYRVTLLISTATQPALTPQKNFGFTGLTETTEIISEPHALHAELKRVTLEVPENLHEPIAWETLASGISSHRSVLCIVNRRNDARDLWRLMPPGAIHLSRLMCGQHLSDRIAEIKARLKDRQSVRVVSTQLVEAGVDLDFPVVFRALAGLDSIAQAAGRCNREGLLDHGEVHVFIPPTKAPLGLLRMAADGGRQMLAAQTEDHLAPDRFFQFFTNLYWKLGSDGLDREQIGPDLAADPELRFSFRSAAAKFRLIDDSLYSPVVVPYQRGAQLIARLERDEPDNGLLRELQRYTVNLFKGVHSTLQKHGVIRETSPGIFVLTHPSFYDADLGFNADASIAYDPDDLVI